MNEETKKYAESIGLSDAEKKLQEIQLCRDVVQSIMNLNPTQEQILLIIQNLGLELVHHEQMVEVVAMTKEFLKGRNALIVPDEET
jgi:hypothetical protein